MSAPDYRVGDVLKARYRDWPEGSWIEGAVYGDGVVSLPRVCGFSVPYMGVGWDVEVVSRAPRPLYVNHPRTAPLMNDVARNPGEGDTHRVWIFDGLDWWFPNGDTVVLVTTDDMPKPLRLLVDGETGQVVP